MWPEAEAKFREAIAAGFVRAEGPYFLGLALSAQGKHREAAGALRSVAPAGSASTEERITAALRSAGRGAVAGR